MFLSPPMRPKGPLWLNADSDVSLGYEFRRWSGEFRAEAHGCLKRSTQEPCCCQHDFHVLFPQKYSKLVQTLGTQWCSPATGQWEVWASGFARWKSWRDAFPTRRGGLVFLGWTEVGSGLCPGRFTALNPHFAHLPLRKAMGMLHPPCSLSNPLIPVVPGEIIHRGGEKGHSPAPTSNLLPKEGKEKLC